MSPYPPSQVPGPTLEDGDEHDPPGIPAPLSDVELRRALEAARQPAVGPDLPHL